MPETESAEQSVDRLVSERKFPDAVRRLGIALSPENALQWANECVKQLQPKDHTKDQTIALEAVGTWLSAHDDANRRASKDAAEKAGVEKPEGALAMAVFFSGGSIAPTTAPEVPPPPDTCQRLAAAAVILAVVSHNPERAPERFQKTIQLGIKAIREKR